MRAIDRLTPAVRRRRRVAAGALLISAPVNAVGVTALIAMYIGFAIGERSTAMSLGRTNDILGLIGAALMAPAVIEIHALTGPDRRVVRAVLAVVGIGAIFAIIWLQFLLVTERMPFEEQIGLVSVAYVAVAVWFIGGGWLASQAGIVAGGARLGVLAATYVGQPWWAYRWGRRLLELAGERAEGRQPGGSAGSAERPAVGR